MGTRSTIKFYNDGEFMAAIYQQYDGYLKGGVGEDLANFLDKIKLINGISMGDNSDKANGVGCLVAQYIATHKKGIGGLYITTESDSQEYNYRVYFRSSSDFLGAEQIEKIIVDNDGRKPLIYGGNLTGFLELCEKGESED